MSEQVLRDIIDETKSGIAVNQSRIIKLVRSLQKKGILTIEEATDILTKLPLMTK